jgi:hypothetical protein
MFNPGNLQPTDQEWLISKRAYVHLCNTAAEDMRSRPATARRMINRFFQLARRVNFDLSRMKFDIAGEPLDTPVTLGNVFRAGEIDKVCRAGQFPPDALLEVVLSSRGLKEQAA